MLAGALAALLTSAGAASFDGDLLATCLAGAQTPGARADCIGVPQRACIDAAWAGEGDRVQALVDCTAAEQEQWDGRLAEAEAALRRWLAGAYPENLPALEAQIAAWLAFRDAVCGYEGRAYAHGTAGIIATEECVMRQTAAQALRLMQWSGE